MIQNVNMMRKVERRPKYLVKIVNKHSHQKLKLPASAFYAQLCILCIQLTLCIIHAHAHCTQTRFFVASLDAVSGSSNIAHFIYCSIYFNDSAHYIRLLRQFLLILPLLLLLFPFLKYICICIHLPTSFHCDCVCVFICLFVCLVFQNLNIRRNHCNAHRFYFALWLYLLLTITSSVVFVQHHQCEYTL